MRQRIARACAPYLTAANRAARRRAGRQRQTDAAGEYAELPAAVDMLMFREAAGGRALRFGHRSPRHAADWEA